MMFLELKNVIWLVVANLFCNMNLLKNSQEMLRNDWLACMMARMIISASSFASAWKVINYQECPHTFVKSNKFSSLSLLFYQQVCTFTCWSGLRPAFIPRISSMIFSASTWEKNNDFKIKEIEKIFISICALTLSIGSYFASCIFKSFLKKGNELQFTILPFCQ